VVVLLGTHEAFVDHDAGPGHAESPERIGAALEGIAAAGVGDQIARFAPRRAVRDELSRVHDVGYLDYLEERCLSGGGSLDPDTGVGEESFEAALRAAGAGPDAIERLDRGEADAAFLVVRPPGHHALRTRAMGFCLLNNIAITAAALVARGERVLIVDWDAHHGNGTQSCFYDESEVLFVSLHQYPYYPGTGALSEVGDGAGTGATINIPFPAGTTGDAYRMAIDEVIVPAAELFSPTWLLVSCGFDAHRADPLTDMALTAGDFADLTMRIAPLAPPGRRIFFLEGGYDLEALGASAGATVAALAGVRLSGEPVSSRSSSAADRTGRPAEIVTAAHLLHERMNAR